MRIRKSFSTTIAVLAMASCLPVGWLDARADQPALETIATHDSILWNGVTLTEAGRVFVSLPTWLGQSAGVAEIIEGKLQPFPGNGWNTWKKGDDASRAFVSVNAVRYDKRTGILWVVDAGTVPGGMRSPGAAKLVGFNVRSGDLHKVIALDQVLESEHAAPNDIRIRGKQAYLSEPGTASLLTVDLETGDARRHLTGHPLLTANPDDSIVVDGRVVTTAAGKPFTNNANQLEISPDGELLYIQPLNGGMARIETSKLDSGTATEVDLIAWVDTPPTSGTAMSADGTIYLNSINDRSIIRISPSGEKQVILQDERLRWADASWITPDGHLWLPIAQLAWTPMLNNGESSIKWPNALYRLRLPEG